MRFYRILLDAADTARPNKALLSQQVLMELLVGNMNGREYFQGTDGEFQPLELWPGLKMDVGSCITEIDFGTKLSFSGNSEDFDLRPGGTIDLQWLPETTKKFFFGYLGVHGTLETAVLPRGVEIVDVADNKLCGPFDMPALPKSIQKIEIQDNSFSGSLLLSVSLPSLIRLDAQCNRFSGNLDLTCLPPKLKWLFLSSNEFFGSIDLSQLPECLRIVEAEDNNLAQEALIVGKVARNIRQWKLDIDKFPRITDVSGNELKMVRRGANVGFEEIHIL